MPLEHLSLADNARAAMFKIIDDIMAGEIEVKNGAQAANLLASLDRIHRLEDHSPTDITMNTNRELLLSLTKDLTREINAADPTGAAMLETVDLELKNLTPATFDG